MGAFVGIEYRVQPRLREFWGADRGDLFGVDSVGIDDRCGLGWIELALKRICLDCVPMSCLFSAEVRGGGGELENGMQVYVFGSVEGNELWSGLWSGAYPRPVEGNELWNGL